jgi:hypothetical protein
VYLLRVVDKPDPEKPNAKIPTVLLPAAEAQPDVAEEAVAVLLTSLA